MKSTEPYLGRSEITVRDHIAIEAMKALVSNEKLASFFGKKEDSYKPISKEAYKIADSLIIESNK